MEALPSSIEAYLSEAGFSGTEIIVLKKLLEEDALTLRELAAKTGKSTGVLDQAVKKLLKKKILSRETINDTPKYVLKSLNSILEWMEEDTKLKQQMMQRRHENFESFVRSLTVGKKRPEMEYFEGLEGLKRAYTQLLERGNDIVQYGPIVYLAEEDPLRDFRVQWFRERRNKGIFSRVITHNTPLGRRFQSRDVFEYRKTILVDPDAYSFAFEKVITGDTVACFQLEDERACFIKYPELAQEERSFFERLWNKKIECQNSNSEDVEKAEQLWQKPKIPIATEAVSQLREFFLSRKSIAMMVLLGILSASLTYGLYWQNFNLNTKRIQDRVKSIAATGALQFDPMDLDALRTPSDITKPEYKKVIYQLNEIRRQNEGVTYIYIMRPTDEPNTLEFVADADSLNPYEKKDLNGDGVVDDADWLSPPGEPYDISAIPAIKKMFREKRVMADAEPHVDQWGAWISGHGPIIQSGAVVALLGVDIDVNRVEMLTKSTFTTVYWFIGFLFLFIFLRLAAFNRSLLQEFVKILRAEEKATQNLLVKTIFSAMALYWITFGLYFYTMHLIKEETGKRLLSIVSTAVAQINPDDLEPLRFARDMKSEEYQRVFMQLNDMRNKNADITYVYIVRPTDIDGIWEFVADADSNYYIPNVFLDYNKDGGIDEADENVAPGVRYDIKHSYPEMYRDGYNNASYEYGPEDQWGESMSARVPIINNEGEAIAILGADKSMIFFDDEVLIALKLSIYFISMLILLISLPMLKIYIVEYKS